MCASVPQEELYRMRVAITGATGLIGRKLFAALRERNAEVTILSRNPAQAQAILPHAAHYIAWEPAEQGAWGAAIAEVDAVIHLAGAPISKGLLGPRWSDSYKAEILNSRVIGTRGLVKAMRAAPTPPATFICASAVGFYGPRDDSPLDENAAAGDDFVARVCKAWEAEAAQAASPQTRAVMLRTGLVLDPDDGVLPQIIMPFRTFTGGPMMPGTQYYSWIHPDDEIGLILFALDHAAIQGPLNATAPAPVTNREFAETIGKVLNSPSWLAVPQTALRLMLGEMADLIVTGQRVLPRKALDHGYQFRYTDLEAALRNLIK